MRQSRTDKAQDVDMQIVDVTARSELRKVLFLVLSVTDMRQIHTDDVFGPWLGRV